MPTGDGTFFAWPNGGLGAALLILLAVLLLAGFWIRRLRRTIAAKNERLVGEAERRGAAEDRTRWVSDHDVYTGLPRLHRFVDAVNQALARLGPFIAGLPGKQRNRSIVRATIAMAHELGLAVVAEGVDDEAVMSILREDRCDRAQGFLIAEPLPEAQFLEFFADNRRRSMHARTGG